MGTKFDNDVLGCTGLLAGNIYGWQGGLRYTVATASKILGMRSTIITPMNGYGGWEPFAESIIRRKPKRVYGYVHSNGGKFITFIAHECWKAWCPTEFVIIMFDRTLGYCRPLQSNVIAALDMHVNKSWLQKGETFGGMYSPRNYRGKTSHIGVINHKPAQAEAFKFTERWKLI